MGVLFGSYARGDYSVRSDIDLLVVYSGKPQADAYSVVRRCLELPRLEPHVYSVEEYRQAGPAAGVTMCCAGTRHPACAGNARDVPTTGGRLADPHTR